MQLRLTKKILAMSLCIAMFSSDCLPIFAETVSGSDLPAVTIQEQGEDGEKSIEDSTEGNTEENTDVSTPTEEVSEPESDNQTELDPEQQDSSELPQENSNENMEEESSVSSNSVSSGDEKEIADEETPLGDALDEVTLEKEVNGVTVTLTAAAGVLPDDAILSVKEIPQTGTEGKNIQKALDEKAMEKAETVLKYRAFDITVLKDGEKIQPDGDVTVSFTGDLLLTQNREKNISVYYVDKDTVASEVKSEVAADAVEMTTSHFSVYAVTETESVAETMFNITVEHYLAKDSTRAPFYEKDEIRDITSGSTVQVPVQGGEDYEVDQIKITNGAKEISVTGKELTEAGTSGIDINGLRFYMDKDKKVFKVDLDEINTAAADIGIEMLYQPVKEQYETVPITAFDYSVMSEKQMEVHDERLPIWYDVVISCKYKGVRYENVKFRQNGLYRGEEKLVSVEENTVFEDLSIKGQSQVYNKAYYETRNGTLTVYYDGLVNRLSAKNAGINSYGAGKKNYLAMGQTGHEHDYECHGGTKPELNANINNAVGGTNVDKAIIPGLIAGLTGDYKDVVATVDEPGYFNDTPLVGKTIYDDRFTLEFDKVGHKYSLISAIDTVSGRKTKSDKGNNEFFFPLNDVERNDTIAAINAIQDNTLKFDTDCLKQGTEENNCFFGLRYDFTFKLGDYIGPLQYTFVGDDDLWVFMDGKIVLDLGGQHQAYPVKYNNTPYESNTVDLWKFIDPDHKGGYDREKEHQITVLFMERGAWNSSCYMEFILPDAAPMDSVITEKPKGNIEFVKTDDKGTKLEGAVFEACRRISTGEETTDIVIKEAVSDKEGRVSFTGLKEGQYIVKEIKAPDGYMADGKEYEVTVIRNKTVTVNGGKVINKKLATGKLEFTKIDSMTKEKMEKVTFKLSALNSGEGSGKFVTRKSTSDLHGKVVFKELPEGEFLLQEEKVTGYEKAGPWIVVISRKPEADGMETALYTAKLKGDVYEKTGSPFEKMEIENIPETGSLKIRKTVDQVNLVYGAPSFTFKIEGPDGLILYRAITFENGKDLTKEIVVRNVPVGKYKVTELKTLRYTMKKSTDGVQTVTPVREPVFEFENDLTDKKKYSHSDIVINSFRMDKSGSVNVSRTREVTEEEEVTDDNEAI